MTVRVGMIGAGFVADIHLHAYHALRGGEAKVMAVAATSLESAQQFANKHAIAESYADYRHLLDNKDIDVVDICTPNATHEAIVLAAAEAGKHVIVEKPLTGYFGGKTAAKPVGATPKSLMLAEAMDSVGRMIDAAHQAQIKLMYAENWVYAPAIQRLIELAEHAQGTIFEIRGEESHSGSHSKASKRWEHAGGGSLIRLAAHPIGAALYIKMREGMWRTGSPILPVAVTAETADLSQMASFQSEPEHWIVDDWHDVENWSTLIIHFSDGSRATIQANDVSLGGIETPFEIIMSNGRIRCDMSHSGLMKAFAPNAAVWGDAYLMEKVDHKGGWSYPSVDEHWLLGYPQEISDFVTAIREDRQPLSTAELGRAVVQVIYAGYLSAEQGKRITLPEGN